MKSTATQRRAKLRVTSQVGQQLLAGVIWDLLERDRPSWLPSVNPYNAEIAALFGDQGGY